MNDETDYLAIFLKKLYIGFFTIVFLYDFYDIYRSFRLPICLDVFSNGIYI